MTYSPEKETIVAAALCIDGITLSMPPPARHHHLIQHVTIHWFKEDVRRTVVPDQQGFLTNTGRFVMRREAARIAIEAGQITDTKYYGGLYSEDLW